ncbi:MAG: sensor domain-containing diguanylate cyclase [Chlamydiae bacterium]|nr:sensor domain-containing diguanylate cyclase [Chlamydiota bacterium]MBI3276168.1 sensor domain-containing diguanylate cyclase [Chlamydiota bacterium]
MNRYLSERVLTVLSFLLLVSFQLFITSPGRNLPQEWIKLSSLFYIPIILLARMSFSVLGTLMATVTSLLLSCIVFFRGNVPHCWGWLMIPPMVTLSVFISMQRFHKMRVQRKIELQHLEAECNDVSEQYAKHKAMIKSLKNKISHFSTLRCLGEKLVSTLSLDTTGQKTLEAAHQLIGKGDKARVFLLDNNLKTLIEVHQIDLTEDGKTLSIDPDDLFNPWILKNHQNLLVQDLPTDFRFKETSKKNPQLSLIASPLITENKLLGVLRMESIQSHAFQLEDLRMLATLSTIASTALKNARLYGETLELSIKDGLTGLYVPTHYHQELEKVFGQARKKGQPLSLLMADIDYFKSINDQFGHTVGDSILKKISEILRQEIHPNYLPTRYGGEEFSAFFPGWNIRQTIELCETLRKKIEQLSFEIRREILSVTISIGVSEMKPNDLSKEDLIHRTDQALYQAKRTGRNRVCLES